MMVLTPQVLLDFSAQPLGKADVDGLRLTNVDFDPWPYDILTPMGGSEKAQRLTKQEIVIQVNLNKLANYTIMQGGVVVMHATSYDVLVGSFVPPKGYH